MEPANLHDPHINEIRKEYKRIDNDWLMLHDKMTIGLVLFVFAIECAMGLFLIRSDMLTTTVGRYIWKFIAVPSGLNFLCLVVDAMAMRSKRFSQEQKIGTVSFVFVVICFNLFSVHSAFTATYYFFAVAVILTTVYLSYRITAVTALLGITALGVSELFVKWDADKISVFESTLRMSNFLISLFILIACAVVCMVEIRYERKKNEASIQIEMERRQLKRILQLDELTGIFNRKSLHDALKDMEENAPDDRYILAITDIDNFKGVNDRFGHQAGDHCLMEFSKILKEHGKNASIFRYGGDEFCLLFHHADIQKAVSVCEQIQSRLSGLHFEAYPGLKLTASFGLASYFDQTNAARLFVYADKALYEAKEERNAIRVFSPEDRPAE